MKEHKWSRCLAPFILKRGTRRRWMVIFTARSIITGKIGGFLGPRAGLDVLEETNISCTCWNSNPE